MTGKEIARLVKAHKGKVSIPALFGNDAPYIYAEKQDLIDHFARQGDHEKGR
jgi:glycerol kinase